MRAVNRKQPLMSSNLSFCVNVLDLINSSRLLSVSLWQPERIKECSPDTLAFFLHSMYGIDTSISSSLPVPDCILLSEMPISDFKSSFSVKSVDKTKTEDKFLCMSLSINSSLNSSGSFSQHFVRDMIAESSKFSHPEKLTVVRSLQLPFPFRLRKTTRHQIINQ